MGRESNQPGLDPDGRVESMVRALRGAGHRITPQRLAVLRALAHSGQHPSVEQIFQEVHRDFSTTSLATVYKTMAVLKELGQVLELGFAGWGSRYDGRRPYPHPHVVCTQCGAIADPELPAMHDMTREMAAASGYQITHHRMDFFGLCPKCRGSE